jgi:NADH-quinone oxidoreductase subunit M
MAVMTLSSIGLPGTGGFVGEFLVLIGLFQRGWAETLPPDALLRTLSVLAVLGVVLGAWYMLWLYQRVFFGPVREPLTQSHSEGDSPIFPDHASMAPEKSGQSPHPPVRDLKLREILALAPLAILIMWIGVYPRFFLDRLAPTMNELTAGMRQAETKLEMTEDEIRMTKECRISKCRMPEDTTNPRFPPPGPFRHSSFDILSSFGFRPSSFAKPQAAFFPLVPHPSSP